MAKKAKKVENPDLLERGEKKRAGRLVSEYLRGIGQEVTEIISVTTRTSAEGAPVVESRLVSKAEALARHLWTQANEAHDMDAIKLVLDRCEGKPGVQGEEHAEKEAVVDRISRLNTVRINDLAEEVMGDARDAAVS